MDSIVIDQTKIRLDEEIAVKGAAPFPRPLAWWQRTLPVWVDVAETEDGCVVLSPNGKVADGRVRELTPADRRRYVKQIARYLAGRRFLDFSDAIVHD